MSFKSIYSVFISSLLLLLSACSDKANEADLVDLFNTASQDLISISFPVEPNETIISIDTFFDYRIEGLKTNGVDTVAVSDNILWTLSEGAISTIDQSGRVSTGSLAEVITVTAKLGILTTSLEVMVSAAKFDRVIQLNSTPVLVNMCQAQQIKPIGSYLNDDGTEEIRPVSNSVINSITWLIRNQEDDLPSQRARVQTVDNITELRALETGDVIIQARAKSLSSGDTITSIDFNQTLDHNLNSLKLCQKSETGLATCLLSSADITQGGVISLMAVANYQAADGSNFNQNISALSKWGIDDISNATIALSADRQQLDVTGEVTGTAAIISVACGNIEPLVTDSDIDNGVVLNEPVTCAVGNLNCLRSTADINISNAKTLSSLTVTANNSALVDNTAFLFAARPASIVFLVTANFSDGSSQDVTIDSEVVYNNRSGIVIVAKPGSPGEYNVLASGTADVQIIYQSQTFIALMTIPN